MEEFTKGKAVIDRFMPDGVYIGDQLLASVYPHEPERNPECYANASRIAACWNACEGVSTEDLEQMVAQESADLWAMNQLRLVAEQRDTLLAALKLYQEARYEMFAQCCSNPVRDAWGRHVSMAKFNDAAQAADKAIIKTEGTKIEN